MNRNVLLSFVVGIACGVCVMLIWMWNQNNPHEQEEPPVVVEDATGEDQPQEIAVLVVTSNKIPMFETIMDEMVTIRSMRVGDVPPQALQKLEDLKGMVLISPVYEGDVITRPKLALESESITIPSLIPEGFRAYTIPIDGTRAGHASIRPFDVVDVFTTYKEPDPEGGEQLQTRKVLSGIRVFAIGGWPDEGIIENATLLVKPHQIVALMMADQNAPITLAVRAKPE